MASGESDSEFYVFPALRGIQAGREYYVTMCPIRLIPKVFIFDSEEIPAKLRAQRTLNKARIPEIAGYIVENPKDYAFSAITASIDGKVAFEPNENKDSKLGILKIPMSSRFLINDGQHRRAAIEEALRSKPELGVESIAVVFFIDAGLRRSQQLFADLNKHAVRPTKSLGILYDHRDSAARGSLDLIEEVPIFKGRVEVEKTSISNRSLKLFTLSSIYQGTKALFGKTKKNSHLSSDEVKQAAEFWIEVSKNIPHWKLLMENPDKVSPSELRKEYIHAHGLILQSLGETGASLFAQYPNDWRKRLQKLKDIDWLRSNKVWEGRATIGGRVSKAQSNVILTTAYLKRQLGVSLSKEETTLEEKYGRGRRN